MDRPKQVPNLIEGESLNNRLRAVVRRSVKADNSLTLQVQLARQTATDLRNDVLHLHRQADPALNVIVARFVIAVHPDACVASDCGSSR